MMDPEARYMAGYAAGRAMCLVSGASEDGRRWLLDRSFDAAYIAGFEWALFDYDDANGLSVRTDISGARRLG